MVVNAVLPPSQATTIVDVGCGTGANLAALSDQYSCVGIDTSSEADVAWLPNALAQSSFVCGTAYEMPDDSCCGRLIMLNDVLEHVRDDFRMLSELLSRATPGCHFLMTVPADLALWSRHDESFGHYRRYSKHRLEQVWQGLPVACDIRLALQRRLYPLSEPCDAWANGGAKVHGRAGTDFTLPNPAPTHCSREYLPASGAS